MTTHNEDFSSSTRCVEPSWSRRRFMQAGLATAAVAGAIQNGLAQESPVPADRETMADVPFAKREPRIGLIGVGGRGTSLLQNLLAANAQIIGIYEKLSAKYGKNRRWRIEHFQIVDPVDIPRLAPA